MENKPKETKNKKHLSKKWKALIACTALACVTSVGIGIYFGFFYEGDFDFSRENFLKDAKLVWSDEFDGNELDSEKWIIEATNGDEARRGGYWTKKAVEVNDGALTIKTYKGENDFYYSGAVSTAGKYESKYGYYEIRCILPKACGIWSAFWMMPIGSAFENGGKNAHLAGAEIDIFEAPSYDKEVVQQAVHIGGYGKNHKSVFNVKWLTQEIGNIYKEYHRYGLYWDKDKYIFYVDGKEMWETDMSGNVSRIEEYIILSTEIGGKVFDGVPKPGVAWGNPILFKAPNNEMNDWEKEYEFKIDYIRHYK